MFPFSLLFPLECLLHPAVVAEHYLRLFLVTLQSVITCEGVVILMRQSCLVSTVDGDTLMLQMVQAYLGRSGSVQG